MEGSGCGSGVAVSPPGKQGQLLPQVGFAGKSFSGRPEAMGPFVSGSTVCGVYCCSGEQEFGSILQSAAEAKRLERAVCPQH